MKRILLAPNEKIGFDSKYLKWPLLGSTKFDGHRLLVMPQIAACNYLCSRNGKPQPNVHLPEHLKDIVEWCCEYHYILDGELWVPGMPFNELASMLRTEDGKLCDELTYYIFDILKVSEWEMENELPFFQRYVRYMDKLRPLTEAGILPHVECVEQINIEDSSGAQKYYERSIETGHEGIILREPFGIYKHGRSTLQQGVMFKFKEWVTIDAKIIGFEQAERMRPEVKYGARETDAFGSIKSSTRRDDVMLIEDLGSIEVELTDGTRTHVGQAKEFGKKITWDNKADWLGKWVEIRYMRIGTKDRPRFGLIVRAREELDKN